MQKAGRDARIHFSTGCSCSGPEQAAREMTAAEHAQEELPRILEIYREPLKTGAEAAYRAVEEDAARICARMKFPHSHLAIESLTGPKEVWWLNAFGSEEEKDRVARDYAGNPALAAALERNARRKQDLIGTPADIFAAYRADLSHRTSWRVAGARYFVVTVTRENLPARGSVFVAPDGTRYIFRPVSTRQQADALAADSFPETTVFAVRPYWGMPSREWIAADPDFWKPNPMTEVE